MAEPMPSSDRLSIPKNVQMVVLIPITSAPRPSRNSLREKKLSKNVAIRKNSDTFAFVILRSVRLADIPKAKI